MLNQSSLPPCMKIKSKKLVKKKPEKTVHLHKIAGKLSGKKAKCHVSENFSRQSICLTQYACKSLANT